VLFERRLRDGLVDGSINTAFRRWRRCQVVAGGRYRLGAGAGVVHVQRVDVIDQADLTLDDARAAGFGSLAALEQDLGGPSQTPIYRIVFGGVDIDPRDVLRQNIEQLDELTHRVNRIERAQATLTAIQRQPGVRAADLMGPLGWAELQPFKLHVRRLKALGLTISLPVGYRLSPRGEAYLALVTAARPERRTDHSPAAAPDRAARSAPDLPRAQTRAR
jgi:hypothetical protein